MRVLSQRDHAERACARDPMRGEISAPRAGLFLARMPGKSREVEKDPAGATIRMIIWLLRIFWIAVGFALLSLAMLAIEGLMRSGASTLF
jgi:hypothetical protein